MTPSPFFVLRHVFSKDQISDPTSVCQTLFHHTLCSTGGSSTKKVLVVARRLISFIVNCTCICSEVFLLLHIDVAGYSIRGSGVCRQQRPLFLPSIASSQDNRIPHTASVCGTSDLFCCNLQLYLFRSILTSAH